MTIDKSKDTHIGGKIIQLLLSTMYSFIGVSTWKASKQTYLLRSLSMCAYRVFFLNDNDRKLFLKVRMGFKEMNQRRPFILIAFLMIDFVVNCDTRTQ